MQIKTLTLHNFKGVRHLEVPFVKVAADGAERISQDIEILGANGTGKTTIFDAYLWLLFGKDSHGNTEFSIKTIGEDGQVVLHEEHWVEATVIVDYQTHTLRREYKENWIEGELVSHSTLYEIDGANSSMSMWNMKVCGGSLSCYKRESYGSGCNLLDGCPQRKEYLLSISNVFYLPTLTEKKRRDLMLQWAVFIAGGDLEEYNGLLKEMKELNKTIEVNEKMQEQYAFQKTMCSECQQVHCAACASVRIENADSILREINDKLATCYQRIDECKERVDEILEGAERRINKLFVYARISFTGKAMNGNEYECCEISYKGIPYKDMNTAAKINIGLDIVNGLQRLNSVFWPVFVDNAESVTTLIPTSICTQLIRLKVSNDNSLIINNN